MHTQRSVSWVPLAALVSLLTGCARDSCTEARDLPRIHPDNPYFYVCQGRPYLMSHVSGGVGVYRRVGAPVADPARLHVLAYRFADDGQQLYFVAIMHIWYHDSDQSLKPMPGVDLRTLEILGDYLIRDARNEYLVDWDSFQVQPRTTPKAGP